MPKYSVFVIRGCSQTCSILAHSQANTGSAEGLGTCQVAFNAEQLNDYAMDLIKFTTIQLRFRTSQLSTLGSTKFKIKIDLQQQVLFLNPLPRPARPFDNHPMCLPVA